MHIDRDKFLKLIEQFDGEVGFLTSIINKIFSMLPTPYLDKFIEDYYYTYVIPGGYYEVYNPASADSWRFPHIALAKDFMRHNLKLSDSTISGLVSGNTRATLDGYRLRRVLKKETNK